MSSPHASGVARARALVLQYGWNTTTYQLLNPGFMLWFSAEHEAVVGYVRAAGTRVVGGAPVCAAETLPAVAAEFERDARAAGDAVCYFAAEDRLDALYRASPRHVRVRLGAQPVWDPHAWAGIMGSHASLRAQCNRARNKGVAVAHWPGEHARHHPALAACLRDWLGTRGLPPLHFLVEPETLDALDDRAVFVAERDSVPVGFLVASPIPARNGWLVEQFVRGRGAPNGAVELMLDAAVRWMAASGATYVTLGLAPLSGRAGAVPSPADPWWLRAAFTWVHAHGRRFYNFDGLDAFKAKYDPARWDPVFAIVTGTRVSPRALYAIAAAFTDGRPVAAVARGIARAAQQEWRRVAARITPRT